LGRIGAMVVTICVVRLKMRIVYWRVIECAIQI